ncbi:hypothetical protein AAFC00_006540 [Neodothiora populina]|uniref:AMMECR1 domain-containing protein n=1 Tax=Neodothiora populina TaxID=2781224 RepID=A0ABR3PAF1_9PEZI
MATRAHCAFCFETLAASFEKRPALTLAQVQQLWDQCYNEDEDHETDDAEMTDVDNEDDSTSRTSTAGSSGRPAAISRLLRHVASQNSASSSSTLTSSSSSGQSSSSTAPASQSSSRTSLSSASARPEDRCPLFITWNTISPSSGNKSLRGCIGTFQAQPLEEGLSDYALTSAFEDHRFMPISKELLPKLQCCVTLLTNFSAPTRDPFDWTIGVHGIRISFTSHSNRLGATYLPDVALEQGWTKEEAIISLMRKAGWSGKRDEWRKVSGLELVRYEGKKVDLNYKEWKQWRDWVEKKGNKP